MNDSVSGLILNQSDYREHDVMISVMTAEYGRISFIAAGARKMTSKNAGSILPYTKAEIQFDYKAGRTLFRLKTARTLQLYRNIHEDLQRLSAAAVIAEICCTMCDADIDSGSRPEEYRLLETSFALLNGDTDPGLVCALYLSDMMNLFGIGADADECVRCGSKHVYTISPSDGGFLCADCAQGTAYSAKSVRDLKRFRLIVKGGLDHAELIGDACEGASADLKILAEMLRLHAGIELKSCTFFSRMYGR